MYKYEYEEACKLGQRVEFQISAGEYEEGTIIALGDLGAITIETDDKERFIGRDYMISEYID